MFPTIFTLTMERSHAPTAATSGLLCMAIAGGAVIMGSAADDAGLSLAYFVLFVSYVFIAIFALAGSRVSRKAMATGAPRRPFRSPPRP